MYFNSPLRYPGGKSQLSKKILKIIQDNNLIGGTYIEPYAGGSGAALYLLLNKYVNEIYINDFDYCIYAFWHSILNETDRFSKKIIDTPITIEQWKIQKSIYLGYNKHSIFEVGFSTFFLNRTNRSGIIKGGIIGGKKQDSEYKLDCRFNKPGLINRIEKIAKYKDKIFLSNLDAINFLDININKFPLNTLIFLDPPYYLKGQKLYTNFYEHNDHVILSKFITGKLKKNWIITYDNHDEIKKLYADFPQITFDINYTVAIKSKAKEIMIYNPALSISF